MTDSEEDNREIQKRNKQRIERAQEDFKKIISLPEGRRFIAKLLFSSCAFDHNLDLVETSFNVNSSNASFTEGSARFGRTIFNEIMRISPQTLIQIRREHESDQRSNV